MREMEEVECSSSKVEGECEEAEKGKLESDFTLLNNDNIGLPPL